MNLTLAFPLLSTVDYGFPVNEAFSILSDCVSKFLADNNDLTLLLVEPAVNNGLNLSIFQGPVQQQVKLLESIWNPRFRAIIGDISNLHTIENIPNVLAIVNSSNQRFSEKGGYTNQLIHQKAGKELYTRCSELYKKKQKGEVYPVRLSESNLMRRQEGYRFVFLVLGPNLRSDKPDCESSLETASKVLRSCYENMFAKFKELVEGEERERERERGNEKDNKEEKMKEQEEEREIQKVVYLPDRSVIQDRDSRIEQTDRQTDTDNQEVRGMRSDAWDEDISLVAIPSMRSACSGCADLGRMRYDATQRDTPLHTGFNRNILYDYIRADMSSRTRSAIFYQTHDCVVVYDAYPKARVHLLLMLRHGLSPPVDSALDITSVHATSINTLHTLARAIAGCETIKAAAQGYSIRLGYHAIPSLRPLHLHLVSNDMQSVYMKTKAHWNSFTTEFFIDISTIEDVLCLKQTATRSYDSSENYIRDEKLVLESDTKKRLLSYEVYEGFLSRLLRCHGCGRSFKNMPQLKRHVAVCECID